MKIFKVIYHCFIFICIAFCSVCANAREYKGLGPFPIKNQNPVYLQNLSLMPVRAMTVSEGTLEFRIDSAYSNLYETGKNSTANVDLDMEYWRISPTVLYGITQDMELGLEIPFVHFNGGFLDAFIQKFHKAFGFPNGGRELVPNGRFSYLFQTNGNTNFNFPPADFGLGDVVLHFKHQLIGEDSDWPALAWFADFKFPTGRQGRGFGSGGPDFGFGTVVDASWKRLHGYFNVGFFAIGGNDMIANYMQNEMLAYSVAGEVSILDNLSVLAQINGSTPLLTKANLDVWDGVPLDLIIGFRGEEQNLIGNQDFIWQVGFSEDLTSVGPSVDFTVFVSLGVRWDIFGRMRPAGDWMVKREKFFKPARGL